MVFCLADVALLRGVPRVAEALGQSPGGQEVERYCLSPLTPRQFPIFPNTTTTPPCPALLNRVWV